ncbi:MAG: hypothetical protein GY930_10370 [bacterium]|nr:hypothetical protein [bacterium]
MKSSHILLSLAALSLFSCHTIGTSTVPLSIARANVASMSICAAENRGQYNSHAEASLPLRIGIAPPVSVRENWGDASASMVYGAWSDRERGVIEDWVERERTAGRVSQFEFLPSILADKSATNILSAVRNGAQARGVDAVLIVRVGAALDVDPTPLSFLDLAIVPAFVFATAEYEAVAVIEGALLDIRTGFPFAVGSAETPYQTRAPSLAAKVREYEREARILALTSMMDRMASSAAPVIPSPYQAGDGTFEATGIPNSTFWDDEAPEDR